MTPGRPPASFTSLGTEHTAAHKRNYPFINVDSPRSSPAASALNKVVEILINVCTCYIARLNYKQKQLWCALQVGSDCGLSISNRSVIRHRLNFERNGQFHFRYQDCFFGFGTLAINSSTSNILLNQSRMKWKCPELCWR